MSRVLFEPTIPVFEWAKIVHALDRAATVIGLYIFINLSVWEPTSLFHFYSHIIMNSAVEWLTFLLRSFMIFITFSKHMTKSYVKLGDQFLPLPFQLIIFYSVIPRYII
jgi:hypothetical protein